MTLVQIQQLSLSPILQDINLQIHQRDLVVLIGKNGSGKTTLLRCISGWQSVTTGSVQIHGQSISELSHAERANSIAALPQRMQIQEAISVEEWLTFSRFRFQESHTQSLHTIRRILEQHQLSAFAKRNIATLSGGEAQRIGLIAMMSQESAVWLLDEPANHLDPKVQYEIYANLMTAWKSGQTMLITTHNLNLVAQTVSRLNYSNVRVVAMADGGISWTLPLDSPDLCTQLSRLYDCHVEWMNEYLVFAPAQQGLS